MSEKVTMKEKMMNSERIKRSSLNDPKVSKLIALATKYSAKKNTTMKIHMHP